MAAAVAAACEHVVDPPLQDLPQISLRDARISRCLHRDQVFHTEPPPETLTLRFRVEADGTPCCLQVDPPVPLEQTTRCVETALHSYPFPHEVREVTVPFFIRMD